MLVLERGASAEPVHPGESHAHEGNWKAHPKDSQAAGRKVIKSPMYSLADLRRVIEEQIGQAKKLIPAALFFHQHGCFDPCQEFPDSI